jgi:hypothetical protein
VILLLNVLISISKHVKDHLDITLVLSMLLKLPKIDISIPYDGFLVGIAKR